MDEDQGIHEHGQPAGEDKHKDGGKNSELEIAPFKAVELLAINRGHRGTCIRATYPQGGLPETAGIQVDSVLGRGGAIGAGYCVMKETGGSEWRKRRLMR
jgi:hypothetical protein